MFSNQPRLLNTLKISLQAARLQGYRVTVVLTGEAKLYTNDLCCTFDEPLRLPNRRSNTDASDIINTLLGSEHQCVVFDAHGGFDERLFAASAGTIVAGGLLILQTPSFDVWYKKSAFIDTVIRKLISQNDVVFCAPNKSEPLPVTNPSDVPSDSAIILARLPDTPSTETSNDSVEHQRAWKIEQDSLVQQLVNHVISNDCSVSVVQGDRGRGKSAIVGRALEQCSNANRTLSITASRQSACAVLIKHAQQTIPFLPIDKALEATHDVLIVEEAGSIPIAVLEQLIMVSKSIVFVTTVQGYEGAGRGFAIRFAKTLDKLKPGWLKLTPTQPVRWSAGDPLEKFVNAALLLDAQIPAINNTSAFSTHAAQVELIDQNTLAEDDNLLQAVYGLLVQAHYQTTPADLRNMLDKPHLLVFAQRVGSTLTGAALVALEGNIPAELHEAVTKKQRRLPDQILPQLLAQSANDQTVLSARFARIVRIAIHPELRNRGFGSHLFEQLSSLLLPTTSTIGASFGADEQSISFWLKQGMMPIHYGYRVNPRSGLRSACLITRGSKDTSTAVNKAGVILHRNTMALTSAHATVEPVMAQLLKATAQSDSALTEIELRDLINSYCQDQRGFIDTIGLIMVSSAIERDSSVAPTQLQAELVPLIKEYSRMPPKVRRESETRLRAMLVESLGFAG